MSSEPQALGKLGSAVRVPSALERLDDHRLHGAGIEVWLKRDDLIHPDLPGNKWRKLKYNLAEAERRGERTLLTFGGAYSNHIRAVAAAGRSCGFETIGVIRGEEHLPLNPSLAYAAERGMRLCYLDRGTYRRKMSAAVLADLRQRFGPVFLLPEGGTNELAARGCAEIPAEIGIDFDVICCPSGTGGTLAGITEGLGPGKRALGFAVLKGAEFLSRETANLQWRAFGHCSGNWQIDHSAHFGGFAKRTASLDAFIADFRTRHGLVLDWVYVAKMMYGVFSLAEAGGFAPGSRVICVITGPPDVEGTLFTQKADRVSACMNPGMVAPRWHGGHVVEHLPFDVLTGSSRVAARLPRGHPGEAIVERLERAGFIGAVVAVPAGLDGQSATLTA
ncbi:MAG: pyridoxal-phosphate dependent enzyme [Nocardiopsaceae bacterium]|jgi:1-aminocyclopropane-1-carboxylate deaminase|nr:pyridoxal-phosphate dependent enzyme [Nocardiopsaceae bacterium]